MSVTFIDKDSLISTSYYTATSKNHSKKLLLSKRNKIKDEKLKSKHNDHNLCQIHDQDIHSTITQVEKTPKKELKRTRLQSSSSTESSVLNSSPEIKYSSPVYYKACTKNNTTIIIKKEMTRRPRKINDKAISTLLDHSDEEEIYDNPKKTNEKDENQSEDKINKSLRVTLRRSTDQSHYKIKNSDNDACTRRSSLRPTITTPIRYRTSDDEINKRALSAKSVKTRLYNEDDESENVNVKVKKSNSDVRKFTATKPNGRNLRNSADHDKYKIDEMNKENDSDDSSFSDKSEKNNKKNVKMKSDNKQVMTPRKNARTMNNEDTPVTKTRKMTRIDEKSDTVSYNTPKKLSQIIEEEPQTPKRGIRNRRSQTPSVKIGSLTPSIRARKVNIEKPKTIFETARAQLHVSAVPKSLPCRENEFNDVFIFLERKLVERSSGCMYISGVPGTGKTATVNEAIRCLKKLVTRGTIEDFDLVEINGMKLSEPRQAYVQILKQLTGQTANWEIARDIVEKKLTNAKNKSSLTLLLIDELDVLCNKRQDVVYNLLDWPSRPSAKLVVITIANTMDLPERVLRSRVTSRLGLTRLIFQPYDFKQLQEIVLTRLNESDAFKSDAVQLVARKVAAVSGDARRALDICRRATEIAEFDQSKIVSMQHVTQALTEMIASPKVRAIKHCSEMEKVFLQSICAEIQRTGVEETTFRNVYKQMETLCYIDGEKAPNITLTLGICANLSASRLILCDDGKKDIEQRIILNVSSDDIYFALNKTMT